MSNIAQDLLKTPRARPRTTLLMSSFVSASRVGATASGFCLRRLGVETLILPTVLLGRHPGWGPPGGGPVETGTLRAMWEGINAQAIHIDAVMTGYMASPAQTALAADIIRSVKAKSPKALILVDPVMGDHGRLYISEPTALAIKDTLLPLADICTPNLWELGYITDSAPHCASSALAAAAKLPCNSLISSVPFGGNIGAIYKSASSPTLAVSHAKFEAVPNGGGDALAGTFLAHRLQGRSPRESLSRALGSIFDIISHAVKTDAGEMPLIREQDALVNAAPLTVREIT